MKVRSGDQVQVISGKDRGKTGRVLRVDPANERVYRRGSEHGQAPPEARSRSRAPTEAQTVGGVIEREGPIHVSNVMLLDPKGKPDARRDRARWTAQRYRVAKRRDEARLMPAESTTARLKPRYLEEIRPALMERFGYSSLMQAPRISKITLNMGVGMAKQDTKVLESRAPSSSRRSPASSRACAAARKSIAAFKLREGMPVGVAVTLRGDRATSSSTA